MPRGPDLVLANRSRRAAMLCYHSVSDPGWPFLSVSPEAFERHLATLRRLGWTTGTDRDLDRVLAQGRGGRPTAFLTFDDGYVDNFTRAFPLLQAYGATATVFIVPPLVDGGAPLRWAGVEEPCERLPDVWRSMTWEMVEQMAAAGIAFGAHTLTHPHLTRVGDEQLRQELLDARSRIVERLGRCDALAYPYGDADARVRAAARDAGYRWAFTIPRRGQRLVDPLAIPRIAVDHRDGAARLALKLRAPTRRLLLSEPARAVLARLRP